MMMAEDAISMTAPRYSSTWTLKCIVWASSTTMIFGKKTRF